MKETKADKIRRLWEQKKLVHPTYTEIAKEVGSNKGYVYKVVQAHKKRTAVKI